MMKPFRLFHEVASHMKKSRSQIYGRISQIGTLLSTSSSIGAEPEQMSSPETTLSRKYAMLHIAFLIA